jgi:hypothetical protein
MFQKVFEDIELIGRLIEINVDDELIYNSIFFCLILIFMFYL